MAIVTRKVESKSGKTTEYYYYEIPLPGGRTLKRSVGRVGVVTKTMARQEEAKKRRELKNLQLGNIDVPILNVFKDEHLKHKRDVSKKRSWKRDEELLKPLCKLFGSKKLSEITVQDLEKFKRLRLEEVSPATVNRSLSVLRHLLNVAKRMGKCYGDNPVSIAGMLEENNLIERVLTLEEENRLLNEAIGYLRPILFTALNTGMRRNEILTLKWSAIDLETNLITIHQSNSKSKKMRRVPINSTMRTMLLELKLKSSNSEYVFTDNQGNPIKTIRTAFEAACKRAGIPELRFHDLRHTAGTRMVETGANIVAISKILGHSDIKTTMRYAHPDESLREALESLAKFGETTTNIATNDIAHNTKVT